ATLKATLMDKNGRCVASSSEPSGVLKVVDVNLWWPYLMHENPAYLYSMERCSSMPSFPPVLTIAIHFSPHSTNLSFTACSPFKMLLLGYLLDQTGTPISPLYSAPFTGFL
uniref:Uncharacterized protein n=1 Tax=Sander lucioperca TaxID=283035 RepID=A0A8D0CUY5_SANLU